MEMTQNEFRDNFVAFILTHGRADNVMTYKTARKAGYTGRIVLVLDDEDEQLEQYFAIYGKENCYVFNKQKYIDACDAIQKGDHRCILYARNACFDIAQELGYKYFIELDDDYYEFSWKFDERGRFKQRHILNLNFVWRRMLEYFISCPFTSLAMAQCGDFIGGKDNQLARTIGTKRKAMNSFICSTDRRFEFKGRYNDDVNTYTRLSQQGYIFLTLVQVVINQEQSQKNEGGMTEVYKADGTYSKSFSSVVVCPSAVKLAMMGGLNRRIHHNVDWKYVAPKIIDAKYKKL